jgi:uncharacterized protein
LIDITDAIMRSVNAARTLREARASARLSQRKLAGLAGVPQPTVARIEAGAVVPLVETLDRLLSACGWRLIGEPRPGWGIDRTSIREMLALTPPQRLALAAKEGRNLQRLLDRATAR